MSHKLIDRSPDLKRLRDEGFELEIKNAHLLVHHVPYVTPSKAVAFGILVSSLNLAGDQTTRPDTHVSYFIGEHPCDPEGNILKGIHNESQRKSIAEGIEIDHTFSSKPPDGYANYYDKIATYVKILGSQAEFIDPAATAKTFRVVESEDSDGPFRYLDSNSSRAEIGAISAKLENLRIAIIGLGGTGSYVLDFIAKTPVKEIHLYDEDDFLSHNAFRAPGAASIKALRARPKKVEYLTGVYSRMHGGVIAHASRLDASNLDELAGMNFVFLCIDEGEAKEDIIEWLVASGVPFVDSGIGVYAVDGKLLGSVRVTTATPAKHDHIGTRVSFADPAGGEYEKNIQIAELNALNAALAVIKWKKTLGFYHDVDEEHHAVYEINMNGLINEDVVNAVDEDESEDEHEYAEDAYEDAATIEHVVNA